MVEEGGWLSPVWRLLLWGYFYTFYLNGKTWPLQGKARTQGDWNCITSHESLIWLSTSSGRNTSFQLFQAPQVSFSFVCNYIHDINANVFRKHLEINDFFLFKHITLCHRHYFIIRFFFFYFFKHFDCFFLSFFLSWILFKSNCELQNFQTTLFDNRGDKRKLLLTMKWPLFQMHLEPLRDKFLLYINE